VAALLADSGRHLSAEQLVEGVRSRLPDTAESTVYRTLAALEELGVISHVHLGHGPATYHLSDTPHRHLVCTDCGTVIDLRADVFGTLAETVEARYGFALAAEHFALSGQCHSCRTAARQEHR
jgi:Fur family ferric uptake transcriptional regulator